MNETDKDDLPGIENLSEIVLNSVSDVEAYIEGIKNEEPQVNLRQPNESAKLDLLAKLINVILMDSIKRRASHIHIEPYEHHIRIRVRIDLVLFNLMVLPTALGDSLASRLKAMAKVDIGEKRLAQDGRIPIKIRMSDNARSRDLDFQVSVRPALWGEKIVLRLLDESQLLRDLSELGFDPVSLQRLQNAISRPRGMVLVTGPSGSGKTNTLYSTLATLNKANTNIMTAEDPIELSLPGVNQVQVNENVGETYATVLRSFVRQDANGMLVGEIRDYETAKIAAGAALNRCLVLSTLEYTDGAPFAVSQLVHMGIEPFLVGKAVNLIVGQRLVHRICARCKTEDNVTPVSLLDIGFPPPEVAAFIPTNDLSNVGFKDLCNVGFKVYKGRGCEACNGTGYKGLTGLYEVLEISEGIRDLIMVGATAVEIKRKALEEGMLTLRQSGLEKIKEGITTIEEVVTQTEL